MKLARVRASNGDVRVAAVDGDDRELRLLDLRQRTTSSWPTFSHSADPLGLCRSLIGRGGERIPLENANLLAPIDRQEVWAAGVTYKRARRPQGRIESGAILRQGLHRGAARALLKATPERVRARRAGPGPPRQQVERPRAGTGSRRLAATASSSATPSATT